MQARSFTVFCTCVLIGIGCATLIRSASAWEPLPVADDPLVRMPGTQPNQVTIQSGDRCAECHSSYEDEPTAEPTYFWNGSMMAQAARDPIFWAALTVAAQDSIWLLGDPNATDLCIRCHSPEGWLEGRSDPTNGSLLTGQDFDGVHCTFCHALVDPHFASTFDGSREGNDWSGYWDEAWSDSEFDEVLVETFDADWATLSPSRFFNGELFYSEAMGPVEDGWDESTGGQYFASSTNDLRANYADAPGRHGVLYSRFHRSRYFCATCHDVSNPVLANITHADAVPDDGGPRLPSEESAAYSYGHLERTFSEFMLSDFGAPGGAPGVGPFAPDVFETSQSNNYIATCQDCHMRDVTGVACRKNDAVLRPTESDAHPNTGVGQHDLTGGNVLFSRLIASAIPGSPNYDPDNQSLLDNPAALTLDLESGTGVDPVALLAGADRALNNLQQAATIQDGSYDAESGELSFRVVNQTGHRLPSGYPEGRRIWVTIQVWSNDALVGHVNPYDDDAHTLRGLPDSPNSPSLESGEQYIDALVYETHTSSLITEELHTFHAALADGLYKDNRIPPRGYRIDDAEARLVTPMWHGVAAPELYSAQEYEGGWDDISMTVAAGADRVEIALYYQVTSREYIEFLRDEINGTGSTLSTPPPSGEPQAYIAQTDPFFDGLRAWGDTIYALWLGNVEVPGAAPIQMATVTVVEVCVPSGDEICDGIDNDCDNAIDEVDDHGNPLTRACYTGPEDTEGVGSCRSGQQVCDWETYGGFGGPCLEQVLPEAETCDGSDNDCDNTTDEVDELGNPLTQACYTGPEDTEGVGICRSGQQVCDWATYSGSGGFGGCEDQVLPATETCDGSDNDCDNATDEVDELGNPLTQACYTGPDGTKGVGPCRGGHEVCDWASYGGFGGPCLEEVVPETEICDGINNDCIGGSDNDFVHSDADEYGDSCDNCPLVDNPGQENTDSDSLGNACDSCPTLLGPAENMGCPVGDTGHDVTDEADMGGAGDSTDEPDVSEPDVGEPDSEADTVADIRDQDESDPADVADTDDDSDPTDVGDIRDDPPPSDLAEVADETQSEPDSDNDSDVAPTDAEARDDPDTPNGEESEIADRPPDMDSAERDEPTEDDTRDAGPSALSDIEAGPRETPVLGPEVEPENGGCGCGTISRGPGLWAAFLFLVVTRSRRRRSRSEVSPVDRDGDGSI